MELTLRTEEIMLNWSQLLIVEQFMVSQEGTIIHKRLKMVKEFTCLAVAQEAKMAKMVILLNITAFKLNKSKEILK